MPHSFVQVKQAPSSRHCPSRRLPPTPSNAKTPTLSTGSLRGTCCSRTWTAIC